MTRALVVFGLAAVLILPIFRLEYFDHWGSAEGPQIAEVRFLRDHWPGVAWNPDLNLGMRSDAVMPPATGYAAAALSLVTGWPPGRAYHFYLGLVWAFGIAGVYALAKAGTGDANLAIIAALMTAVLSPSFLLFPETRMDSWGGVPPRLGVLQRYGDGPHLASLAWFGWMAAACLRKRWGAAALCGAFAAAHSFQGVLLVLAGLCLLAWCSPLEWRRYAMITPVAFAIPAYFLTPSWWSATWQALPRTIRGGDTWSLWIALALPLALVLATEQRRIRKPWLYWCGSFAFLFAAAAAVQYYTGRTLFGQPLRFLPEVDQFVILLGLTLAWKLPRRWALGLACLALVPSLFFLRHAWGKQHYPRDARFEHRVEHDLQRWAFDNLRGQRVLVGGSTRLWWGLLGDMQQMSAGAEVGVGNPIVPSADYQIRNGESAEWALLWLQALGVSAVVVNEGSSGDVYRDYPKPEKFRSLPVLFHNGQGDTVYRVPRRFPSLARVVVAKDLPPNVDRLPSLQTYVDAIERGPETSTEWVNPSLMRVLARVDAGESVLVQVSHDPVWKAFENNRELPVRRDPAGLMLVETGPGDHDFYLVFRSRQRPVLYGGLSLAGLAAAAFLIWRGRR